MLLPLLSLAEGSRVRGRKSGHSPELQGWLQAREVLREELRLSRPPEGGDEETRALTKLIGLAAAAPWSAVESDATRFAEALDQLHAEVLDQVVAGRPKQRKVAARNVQVALNPMYLLLERSAIAPSAGLTHNALHGFGARLTLRWQLRLFMATELLHERWQELAWWAARAAQDGRRVNVLILAELPRLQAVRKRVKAMSSWDRWDETEIERELKPWPPAVR